MCIHLSNVDVCRLCLSKDDVGFQRARPPPQCLVQTFSHNLSVHVYPSQRFIMFENIHVVFHVY